MASNLENECFQALFVSFLLIGYFLVAGAIHGWLGPVISGFNISLVLWSYFVSKQIDIMVWTNILDFLEVNSTPLQWIVVVVSTILGMQGTLMNIDLIKIFSD
ncbi:MAG: hypothetical protein OMM_11087 [Candidatus Magnetoglobus multicellularis str. Araruama]|uniref:Uncharacterized protein n=1 Tax=Candidatus Magnetoglobus multicellularis str. Araruama TaxID=890399 RepID=A0A1V1NZC5_9BACT|nr:MAG: hypothetical protein OMM_11087 [Candidatus Magnetoglobus multicellularis str. Araruama]